jgi:hypothetical protein
VDELVVPVHGSVRVGFQLAPSPPLVSLTACRVTSAHSSRSKRTR